MKGVDIALTQQIAQQVRDRSNLMRYPDGPFKPLRPLSLVCSGFANAASVGNLDKASDGNFITTKTDTASSSGVTGDLGNFQVDLGSNRYVMVGGRVGLWTTTTGVNLSVYIESKTDEESIYDTANGISAAVQATSETTKWLVPKKVYARYIRVRCVSAGSCNPNMNVYQLTLDEVPVG